MYVFGFAVETWADLPAELMEKYSAAAGNHSKKFSPQNLKSVSMALIALYTVTCRFSLLKEFLIADEMLLVCPLFPSLLPDLDCAFDVVPPRRGVSFEGSVEAKLVFPI